MDHSLVIMDSFALPVQGTETRVNAANEANEYMVEYVQGSEKVCHAGSYWRGCNNKRAIVGRTVGECRGVVSFASGIWMLAVGDRRKHTTHKSTIPRSIRRSRCKLPLCSLLSSSLIIILVTDRPKPHHLRWQSRYWCLPHLSTFIHSTIRRSFRVSVHSSEQD
jgi:hypothetical protein